MSQVLESFSLRATTVIPTCAFITRDPTAGFDGAGRVCGVGDAPTGISTRISASAPIAASSQPGAAVPTAGIAANVGQAFAAYKPGTAPQLRIGAGGCNYNDFLKPDANGNGVTATTTGDKYGARALQTCPAGQLCQVEVTFGTK